MEEKKRLRKQILALRDAMPADEREEKSRRIAEMLVSMPLYDGTDILLTYVNYQSEVDTTDLVNKALADGKRVFAPKVSGETMEFYQLTGMEDLQEGYKGIREPVCGKMFDAETVKGQMLMLMPGAVFDEECHRIGYGKGFYDRLLTQISATKIGVAYHFQIVDDIPVEPHDVPVDMVITDKAVIITK